ncbi:hypothetical protein [Actinokineospora terrae]|nr:hypothetical protein [Actinokineospora terrae]
MTAPTSKTPVTTTAIPEQSTSERPAGPLTGSLTPEQRLAKVEAMLSGTRSHSRAARRLRMNRPANVLVGALLHAADRRARGLEPTDLEQRLLDLVGAYLPADELAAFGGAYRDAVARGPVDVLPESITAVPPETGYGLEDLRAALPAIEEHVIAQPNVRVVDVTALDEDAQIDDEEFAAALVEYGRGTTILTGAPGRQTPGAGTTAALPVQLRMHAFHCQRESGEATRDEIYWALASGSDGRAKTSHKTREYGATSTGDWHTFDANTFLFNGSVEHYVSCEVQCWEADDSSGGFYNSLRAALGDFAEAALDLSVRIAEAGDNESKKAAGWAAFLAIGAGLLNAILGWLTNDDDLVVERSFGYDRAALVALSARPNREFALLFDGGGGGRHNLFLRTNPIVDTGSGLRYISLDSAGVWGSSGAFPSGSTGHTPALAAYNGKIHCLVRGGGANLNLHWSSFDGNGWCTFTQLSHTSTVAPALAVLGDKLYAVHRGSGATGTLYWNTFDGTRWSTPAAFPSGATDHSPALAALNGKLYCLVRGAGANQTLFINSFDGTRWSGFTALLGGAASPTSPAVAAFGDKLHIVHRGSGTTGTLYWNTFDGTNWSGYTALPSGSTDHAPALAAANGTLHCLVRGAGANRNLHWSRYDGTRWNTFTALNATSPLAPGLGPFHTTLFAAYIS